MYDVAIIGAGVVGCAIARELSRYNLSICVLEKEADVSCGASKANSGIVHGGYDAKNGTLKARLNVEGNRMFDALNDELHFGYDKIGSLVVGFDETDDEILAELYQNGIRNGVAGLEIINRQKLRELEPAISPEARSALYCSNAGVTSPYEMTIALAENAVHNGAAIFLNTRVTRVLKEDSTFAVQTNTSIIHARFVVNAAGVESGKIAASCGDTSFSVQPRKGQYVLLDKTQGGLARTVIFQVPTKLGKGILVTRTLHGVLMLGPNAEEGSASDDLGTDEKALAYIIETARKTVPSFDMKHVLTSFSGMRAASDRHDFIIEESSVKGFINVAGIESPGLTSSPAIAVMVAGILQKAGLVLAPNMQFDPYRAALIVKKDPSFKGTIDDADPAKNIICRCERVTEAEIVNCIHRGIPVTSLDAVKRRVRAGMGFCQGNFCGARVKKIVARETGLPEEDITRRSTGSSILPEPMRVKRDFYHEETAEAKQ